MRSGAEGGTYSLGRVREEAWKSQPASVSGKKLPANGSPSKYFSKSTRAKWQDSDLLFATEIGTPLLTGNLYNRHFDKIRRDASLPRIRLYDLRHTNATMLLASGVSAKVVAERLGHSSVVLTLDTYSHVLPAMQTDATNRLEEMMFGT